ncbi:hypothetical protein KAU32_02695 [bacterium]|nr:hypothetical protein [bacterium]
MNTFDEVKELPEFTKEFNKLKRKQKTLPSDFKTFIETQLKLFHNDHMDNGGIVKISGLGIVTPVIYKARKFACRSLKGRGSSSGIRVIYAYYKEANKIEFIQIYFKGDQENEDRARIESYYKHRGKKNG